MKIRVLTLFPESFSFLENYGVIGKAMQKDLLEIECVNIRDFSTDKHRRVDDVIFGGGAGMLMMCQPIVDALERIEKKGPVICLSAQGAVLTQEKLKELAQYEEITLLCGHYEGIDARVIQHYCDEELSIGDYVLTGGEIGAMVVIDGVSRMIDGVLGSPESAPTDSHYDLLLQADSYTRPQNFRGHCVPEVLVSGHHARIEQWRRENALYNTKIKRPDIYQKYLERKNKKDEHHT